MIVSVTDTVSENKDEVAELEIYVSALNDAIDVVKANGEKMDMRNIHDTLGNIIITLARRNWQEDENLLKRYTIKTVEGEDVSGYGYEIEIEIERIADGTK